MAKQELKLIFFQAFPFSPAVHQESLEDLKNFQLLAGDIFIVTYPKSGTTWTRQIVKLIRSNGIDDGEKISASIPWIEEKEREFFDTFPQPRGLNSHACYSLVPGMVEPVKSPAKYIYVARNPKDTAVSMYHHVTSTKCFEFQGSWDVFFELFMAGKVVSGLWFDHVLEWWKHKDSPNILFLKYEDMKKDPHQAVRSIATFIRHNLEPQVVESIEEQTTFQKMKNNPSFSNFTASSSLRYENTLSFFRKGVVGDWKNYFTEEQNIRFDELYLKRMCGTGLEFDFE